MRRMPRSLQKRVDLHTQCGLSPVAADLGSSCTGMWDAYDYVDDWPVEDQLLQLLQTHPANLTAGVLLSLRDPWEWRDARLRAHADMGAADWTAPSPCSGHGPRLNQDEAPLAKLSHDAWAACVATGLTGLLAFNLRDSRTGGADFGRQLHEFLSRSSAGTNLEEEKFVQAADACRHLERVDVE